MSSKCVFFKDEMSQAISITNLFLQPVTGCCVLRRPLLLPSANAKFQRTSVTLSNLTEIKRLDKKRMFAEANTIFAFIGGVAVGKVSDSFKPLGIALPLCVVSESPSERSLRNSYVSISPMCVGGLGRWTVGGVHCVEHTMWLGWSLGSLAASAAAVLCETAQAQPRAVVMCEPRCQYPM